jgi:hypothetical protein
MVHAKRFPTERQRIRDTALLFFCSIQDNIHMWCISLLLNHFGSYTETSNRLLLYTYLQLSISLHPAHTQPKGILLSRLIIRVLASQGREFESAASSTDSGTLLLLKSARMTSKQSRWLEQSYKLKERLKVEAAFGI